MTADGMSGTLQDLRKGRPTEVEFFNGFIAAEGKRAGVKVATHAAMAEMIREAERGGGRSVSMRFPSFRRAPGR